MGSGGGSTTRRSPFEEPAQVVLLALRNTAFDAYRCDPEHDGRWHAWCPVCSGWRSLLVTEAGRGGPVSLRCANRCHEQRIVRALARPRASGAPAIDATHLEIDRLRSENARLRARLDTAELREAA